MNYNDEMKRLEGHPAMKEIPENFENELPVAAAGSGAGAARTPRRSGIKTGAILTAIGACLLGALVFWASDSYFSNRSRKLQQQTAENAIPNNAQRATTARTAALAQAVPSAEDVTVGYTAVETTEADDGTILEALDAYLAQNGNTDQIDASMSESTAAQQNSAATADNEDEYAEFIAESSPDAVYLFATDGTAIAENANLNAVAEEAVESDAEVVVTAYTDETGSADYNRNLSERRANAVTDYLVAHGVPRDHITTLGCGPTHSFATNAQDRRAEVRLVS